MEDCLFDKCDKYDYAIAAFSGIIGGIVDSLFVGMPGESKLGKWSQNVTDNFVIKMANKVNEKGSYNNIHDAIQFFENKYKVNYDQATGKSTGELLNMNMSNHHIKSLAHAPDIVGLIFSIIDQFTGKSHFLDNGRLIVFDTEYNELRGQNFISKIFSAIVNWLGHLMSDVAGSSNSRKKDGTGVGSGIPAPFFELLQLCKFNVPGSKETLANLSVKVFESGYDARFAIAMAIPVLITNLSIKLIWSIKHYFYGGYSLKECIPTNIHGDLRCMLLIGNGTLCVIDGVDALGRSSTLLQIALHINYIAWFKFCKLILKEVCIRNKWGMDYLEIELIKIDEQVNEELKKLNSIDISRMQNQIRSLKEMNKSLVTANTEKEIVNILYEIAEESNIELPFHNQNEFDDFMNNDEEYRL